MNELLHFRPPVIAHRGSRARAPENTMAAFAAAREDGAGWIETDVKLTADGVPVLLHDDTLERTTSGRGTVADIAWADLRQLDAGAWFGPSFADLRVPTLADLLHYARACDLRVNLELKPCPGRTQATCMVAMIEAAKAWPETALPPLISSFDIEALVIASRLHPGWPRGLLLDQWRDDWRALAERTLASSIHLDAALVTPARVDLLRRAGLSVLVYTVNDPPQARQLLQAGVDAVFSDDPAAMITAL